MTIRTASTLSDIVSHNSMVVDDHRHSDSAPSGGRGRPRAAIDDAVADAVLRRLASTRSVALSVRDLADEVGVHRSTLYRRWPTEGDLLALALERTAARLEAALPTGTPSPDDLLEAIIDLLDSPTGRGLLRARIILGSTRPSPPPGSAQPTDTRPGIDLDVLVGAVIHRRFVTGLLCDAAWKQAVLHWSVTERTTHIGGIRQEQ